MNIDLETYREPSAFNPFSYYFTDQKPQDFFTSKENIEENQSATNTEPNLQLIRQLGEGKFGQVWEANYNGKPVAVKLFKKSTHEWEKNIEQEINMLVRLPVELELFTHYIGRFNDGFVMELINGSPLSNLIFYHQNSVTFLQLQRYGFQLTAAITWLHENGILHRDIKSNNVMIDSNNSIKLIDFGLACMANQPQVKIGGTLTYLAPEVHFGETNCTEKSDVYSLGCTFWTMQTGHPPWHGQPMITQQKFTEMRKQHPHPSMAATDMRFKHNPAFTALIYSMWAVPESRITARQAGIELQKIIASPCI